MTWQCPKGHKGQETLLGPLWLLRSLQVIAMERTRVQLNPKIRAASRAPQVCPILPKERRCRQ